jgi:O-antigen/teichoic acid export membrane protein
VGSSLWMIVGNGGYAFFQVMVMVLISKYLGVESLGHFSLALALTAPIMLFSNFGLRTLWITDQTGIYSYADFNKIRIYSSIAGVLVCSLIACFYAFDQWAIFLVIIIIALCKMIENQSDLYYGLLHKISKQRNIALSLLLRGFAGFLGVAIGIYIFNELVYALIGLCIFWLLAHLFVDIKLNRKIVETIIASAESSSNEVKGICYAGLPLAVALLLINTNLMIPRLALSEIVTMKELGAYAALAYFVLIGSIVINSIGQVALPTLSKLYSIKKYKEHVLIVFKLIAMIFLLSWVGAVLSYYISPYMLNTLFGGYVATKYEVLTLMFLLAPAQYSVSIMGHALSSTKRNKSLVVSQLAMLVVNLALSLTLIPLVGIYGAVYSSFGASLFSLMFYGYFYHRALKND